MTITDKSKSCILLTLWGDSYNNIDFSRYSSVLIGNGIVTECSGYKAINTLPSTVVQINPPTQVAIDLKMWFDEEVKTIKN